MFNLDGSRPSTFELDGDHYGRIHPLATGQLVSVQNISRDYRNPSSLFTVINLDGSRPSTFELDGDHYGSIHPLATGQLVSVQNISRDYRNPSSLFTVINLDGTRAESFSREGNYFQSDKTTIEGIVTELQEHVQKSRGYHQYCSRILRQSGMFSFPKNSAEYLNMNRHNSPEDQRKYDQQFGLTLRI